MSWAGRLIDLFEDLEQQAAGLALQARDAEVAELGRAQYAEVDLLGRLHATLGRSVRLELRGAGGVTGRLLRVGRGWALVAPAAPAGQEWLVNVEAMLEAGGLSARATVEAARGLATKVSIGSAVRHLAEGRDPVAVALVDGSTRRGRLGRVGADFMELGRDDGTATGDVAVLPFTAIAVLRPG